MNYPKPTMLKGLSLAFLFLTFTISSFAQSGNNIIIDNFATDQSIIFATAGDPIVSSVVSASDVLGMERSINVELISGSNATAEVASGTFNFSVGAASEGQAVISYSGIDGIGLGGLDLTNGGTEDRFKISLISADHAGTFLITVVSGSGDISTASVNFPSSMEEIDYNIFFNDFVPSSGTGADFENVDAVDVLIMGAPEIDVRIDRICTDGPPPTCKLESIVGGTPECIEYTHYSVTVTWDGIDESVTISAGGSGDPASVTADATGTATFTYPLSEASYHISYSDSEELCEGIGSNLSGDAPYCAPPPCGVGSVSKFHSCAYEDTGYSVTVSWTGSDERMTIHSNGGTPASVIADAAGEVRFTYPFSNLNYNITFSDTDDVCQFQALSGTADVCFAGVPTMGEWALICLGLIFLIFGTQAIRQFILSPLTN